MAGRMTGGQAVVRALKAQGVETVFGIPGVHTLALYDALIDAGATHLVLMLTSPYPEGVVARLAEEVVGAF